MNVYNPLKSYHVQLENVQKIFIQFSLHNIANNNKL